MPIKWEKNAGKAGRWRYEFNRLINGQRIRTSRLLPEGWTRSRAETFDRQETARIYAEASGIEQPKRLIEEAVQIYLENKTHLANFAKMRQEFVLLHPWYAGRALDDVPQVSQMYAKDNPHFAPATIRNRLAYLRAAIRYAYKKHSIGDRDYTDRMEFPTVNNERHVYKERAEILRLARACKDLETRAIIMIAFYTGLRWREGILRMTRKNIRGDLFDLGRLKNGKPHMVPIHPKLNVYLKRIPFEKHDRTYYKHFEEAREAAGMPEVTMHTMRHSLASELLSKHGANLRQVAEILGHTSLQATSRYSHFDVDGKRELLNKMGRKK